jgi:TPR repeat protein
MLGWMYEEGLGGSKNHALALAWIGKAAVAGVPEAEVWIKSGLSGISCAAERVN